MRDEFIIAMREVITRLHLEKREDMQARDIVAANDLIQSGIGKWVVCKGEKIWSL